VDFERVLREEVERMQGRLEVFAPVLLRARRSWYSRLAAFLSFTVF
jgi:hypothetical protein